jgi:hypothetical protein
MSKKDYNNEWHDEYYKGRKYPYNPEDYRPGTSGNPNDYRFKWHIDPYIEKEASALEKESISLLSDFIKFTHLPENYKPTMQDNAYTIVDEAVDILISKHEDYGPLNILNAPGGVYNGLAVRLHDKVSRLANLTKTGNQPNHESLRDTLIDIINYAVIGILVSEGNWE